MNTLRLREIEDNFNFKGETAIDKYDFEELLCITQKHFELTESVDESATDIKNSAIDSIAEAKDIQAYLFVCRETMKINAEDVPDEFIELFTEQLAKIESCMNDIQSNLRAIKTFSNDITNDLYTKAF